ncbi:hypothetical protein [Carboxylicivirga caseinilyticus]|uniref:hypothetical protein n=1 Tax=Carboxylicivirga caseinilyticus TaxID=3417572 RepID=UPI003D344012|nr:hypothetical protein [Marinilabiliaceae bacterium A049]
MILLVVSMSTILFGQKAEYGNVTQKAKYTEYLTKNGDLLKVGDTLKLGKAISDKGFQYITQGGQPCAIWLADKVVFVDHFRSFGTKSQGYKVYVAFKGYGLVPVYIDYDSAIEVGEVVNKNSKMTRDEAINKLSEAKKLLDLEIISQEEYDKLKKELTPIIVNM